MIRDYESLAFISVNKNILAEAFRGTDLVSWHGSIENQLVNFVEDFKNKKNDTYAQKVQQFLDTWRAHKFTGSINVEDIDPMEAAASQLAVDNWNLRTYFSSLRDRLKQIKASEEELPRMEPEEAPSKSKVSSPLTKFGAEKEETASTATPTPSEET